MSELKDFRNKTIEVDDKVIFPRGKGLTEGRVKRVGRVKVTLEFGRGYNTWKFPGDVLCIDKLWGSING